MPPAYLRAPSVSKPACSAAAPKGKRRNKPCPRCGQRHTPELHNTARSMLDFYAAKRQT